MSLARAATPPAPPSPATAPSAPAPIAGATATIGVNSGPVYSADEGALPMSMLGRTSVTLLAVLAVILVCAWLLKRLGWQQRAGGARLPVVASRSLGPRERVVIIDVAGQWLVLGVTPQQVNTLYRLPAPTGASAAADAQDAADSHGKPPSFGQALTQQLAPWLVKRP